MKKNNTDKNVAGSPEPTNDSNSNATNDTALETLKHVASALGIQFHHKVGAKKLEEMIEDFLQAQKKKDAQSALRQEQQYQAESESIQASNEVSPQMKRMRMVKDATRLKRIRVTCMNPNKKDWSGEIITASNSVVPTQKKFVAFNVPWHVPQIILNVLKERQCQMFKTVTRGKHKIREPYLIPEFSIEEMAPMSIQEFEDLKKEQAMANRIG